MHVIKEELDLFEKNFVKILCQKIDQTRIRYNYWIVPDLKMYLTVFEPGTRKSWARRSACRAAGWPGTAGCWWYKGGERHAGNSAQFAAGRAAAGTGNAH